ncbi:MAG: alpha/beta hydrolase [Anaerolineaceae bacterium]|nr:alpha/beta hydrolase [Anaerolineaceae bacterium]
MFKRIVAGLFVIIIITISAFVIWGSTPARPDTLALQALESNDVVNVEKGQFWLQFSPTNRDPISGFIFYPGGRVDYRAYAPLMRAIAERGYEVALVKMPLSLAVLGANRADAVIDANPEIPVWYIGGHSLGGAMAAAYVYNNPVSVQGLVLWAAYPAESNDLSQSGFPVLSIYAERDGLATPEKIQASIPLLPKDTMWVEIKGGNHAQFGSYGPQNGDLEASISAEEQHQQIVDAILTFLSGMR